MVGLLGWLAVQNAESEPSHAPPEARWVRTRDGWQTADWDRAAPPVPPTLHPTLVAAFMACGSAAALLAFPSRAAENPVAKIHATHSEE